MFILSYYSVTIMSLNLTTDAASFTARFEQPTPSTPSEDSPHIWAHFAAIIEWLESETTTLQEKLQLFQILCYMDRAPWGDSEWIDAIESWGKDSSDFCECVASLMESILEDLDADGLEDYFHNAFMHSATQYTKAEDIIPLPSFRG